MKTIFFLTAILFVLLSANVKSQNTDPVLCSIKSAALYEPTLVNNYSGQTALTVLAPMNIDYVRGFFRWGGWPYYVDMLYNAINNDITQLKLSNPNLLYAGGISASLFDTLDTWADSTTISFAEKESCKCRDTSGNAIPYHSGYIGDIASPTYRKYVVGWVKKQIDAGIDVILIDEQYLCAQVKMWQGADTITTLTQYAPYFQDIADSVRAYAVSIGRKIYITSNGNTTTIEYMIPPTIQMLDFITLSFDLSNFYPPYLPQENFVQIKHQLDSLMGRPVPLMTFIDWNVDCSYCWLSLFGQLSVSMQNTLLHRLDSATKAAGVIFLYPVFGGNVLSHSDSLYDAVQYGTYDTIVYMANNPSLVPTCNTTQIDWYPDLNNNRVNIFPNPCSNSITFQITDERITNYDLKIFDMLGKIVFTKTLNSKRETLNLNLPGGMYFYQVKDNKQFISSGKLIIQ